MSNSEIIQLPIVLAGYDVKQYQYMKQKDPNKKKIVKKQRPYPEIKYTELTKLYFMLNAFE